MHSRQLRNSVDAQIAALPTDLMRALRLYLLPEPKAATFHSDSKSIKLKYPGWIVAESSLNDRIIVLAESPFLKESEWFILGRE